MALKPDGLVHMVKEMIVERGTRTIIPKCGKELAKYRSHEQLAGATLWNSEVTCEECKP